MKTYIEIKAELVQIAEVLKKYPESLHSEVFKLLIESYFENQPTSKQRNIKEKIKVVKNQGTKKTNTRSKESYTLVKDLNLRGGSSSDSFKNLYETKKPNSAIEFNAVAVYYLSEIIKISPITPDHIYTCYNEVNKRSPNALVQSLRDTSGKKYGYIDTSDTNNIKLPLRGKNFVEHDLPKKIKK